MRSRRTLARRCCAEQPAGAEARHLERQPRGFADLPSGTRQAGKIAMSSVLLLPRANRGHQWGSRCARTCGAATGSHRRRITAPCGNAARTPTAWTIPCEPTQRRRGCRNGQIALLKTGQEHLPAPDAADHSCGRSTVAGPASAIEMGYEMIARPRVAQRALGYGPRQIGVGTSPCRAALLWKPETRRPSDHPTGEAQ